MRAAGAVTWATARPNFRCRHPSLRTLLRGAFRHSRSWAQKEAPGVPGLSWRRKTSAETKKAGSGAGLSASHFAFGLAVAALVSVRREQPSAVARLGAVNTISMRPLPVLGLLGRLSTPCIRRGVRHISLRYDAGKLGEGVGRRPPSAMAGPILAKLNAAMAARSMIFMVSLLIFRPRLSGSGLFQSYPLRWRELSLMCRLSIIRLIGN